MRAGLHSVALFVAVVEAAAFCLMLWRGPQRVYLAADRNMDRHAGLLALTAGVGIAAAFVAGVTG